MKMTSTYPTFSVDRQQPIVVRDFQNAETRYTFLLDSDVPPKLWEQPAIADKDVIAGFCKTVNFAAANDGIVCFFSLEQFRHNEIVGPSWQTSRWFRTSSGLNIDCTKPDTRAYVSRGLLHCTFSISVAGKDVFRHKYRSTALRDALLSDGSDPWGSDFFRFVAWHLDRVNSKI